MNFCDLSLPPYCMTAGEAKTLTIPIYNNNQQPIDMTGMTARLAISDFIHRDSEPFVIKNCTVVLPDDSDYAVLEVELNAADTIDLCGRCIYQVTIKDRDGRPGILKGNLTISANYDKAAI